VRDSSGNPFYWLTMRMILYGTIANKKIVADSPARRARSNHAYIIFIKKHPGNRFFSENCFNTKTYIFAPL
jgi:hypothetical protein